MEENKNSVNESNAAKRLRLLGENMDEKIDVERHHHQHHEKETD